MPHLQLHGLPAAEEQVEVHGLGVVQLPHLSHAATTRQITKPTQRTSDDTLEVSSCPFQKCSSQGSCQGCSINICFRSVWNLCQNEWHTFQLLLIMSATFLWPAMRRPTAIILNFMPCLMRIACTAKSPHISAHLPDRTSNQSACTQCMKPTSEAQTANSNRGALESQSREQTESRAEQTGLWGNREWVWT